MEAIIMLYIDGGNKQEQNRQGRWGKNSRVVVRSDMKVK